jgi:Protein of unknown function (DUF3618)
MTRDVPNFDARDPDDRAAALREDIDQTRQELSEKVAEIAYKVDVKARAKDRVAAMRERPVVPLAAVLGALLTLFGYLWWWRRH